MAEQRYRAVPPANPVCPYALRVLQRVRAIPPGSVCTYGDIDPHAPRAVGGVLARGYAGVPWHRVVRADGSCAIGRRQLALLAAEGVPLIGDRVDFARIRARRRRPERRSPATGA